MFSMADLWSLQTTAAPFTRTMIMILYAQFESAVLLTAMQLMTNSLFYDSCSSPKSPGGYAAGAV